MLRTVTKEMMDAYQGKFPKPGTTEQEILAQQFFDKQRNELQGYEAATIKLVAEPERAFEIAFEEAEKSISILRFFAPANLLPQIISYCVPLGKKHVESKRHLIIKNGEIVGSDIRLADKFQAWSVSNSMISEFKRVGLDVLSHLLDKNKRTEFEDALLNSLLVYSKSSLTKDVSEKLIYILAALEQALLKDNNEQIQQNIGMRLAFLVGKTQDERISIKNNFVTTYGLRSQFVHHGNTIDDHRAVKTFMRNVWLGFCYLIQCVDRFETKQRLFKELEERIYS